MSLSIEQFYECVSTNNITTVHSFLACIADMQRVALQYNITIPFYMDESKILLSCKTVEMANVIMQTQFFNVSSCKVLFVKPHEFSEHVLLAFLEEYIRRDFTLPVIEYNYFFHSEKLLHYMLTISNEYDRPVIHKDVLKVSLQKQYATIIGTYCEKQHDNVFFPVNDIKDKCTKLSAEDFIFISDKRIRTFMQTNQWLSPIFQELFTSRLAHLATFLDELLPISKHVIQHILVPYLDLNLPINKQYDFDVLSWFATEEKEENYTGMRLQKMSLAQQQQERDRAERERFIYRGQQPIPYAMTNAYLKDMNLI